VPVNIEKTRRRSLAHVANLGGAVNRHLPLLDSSMLRSQEAVTGRVLAELAVFHLFVGAPPERLRDWLAANELEPHMSRRERELLAGGHQLETREHAELSWWQESLFAFVWILGLRHDFGPEIPLPDDVGGVFPRIADGESADAFRARVKLRSYDELYAMTDLFYVAHWSARQARLTRRGDPAQELIIGERRRALDWTFDDTTQWDEMDDST
jgi:hypothetical protein